MINLLKMAKRTLNISWRSGSHSSGLILTPLRRKQSNKVILNDPEDFNETKKMAKVWIRQDKTLQPTPFTMSISEYKFYTTQDSLDKKMSNSSPEIKLLRAAPFQWLYDFGEIRGSHSPSDICRLSGAFDGILRLKDIPPQDFHHLISTQNEVSGWAQEFGMWDAHDLYYPKFLSICVPMLVCTTCPWLPLSQQRLYLLTMLFIFTFDDILDNDRDFKWPRPPTIQELHEPTEIFCGILEGRVKNLAEAAQLHTKFPIFLPLCRNLFEIREEASSLGPPPHYFFKSLCKTIRGCVWEYADIFGKQQGAKYNLRSYFYKKESTIAILPVLETIKLQRGIVLEDVIRDHPLFHTFLSLVSRQVILVNDIVSAHKEISYGEGSNLLLIKNHELSLKDSFDEINRELDDVVEDLKIIKEKLDLIFPENHALKECVLIGEMFMANHLLYMVMGKRYAKKCQLDIAFSL